MKKLQFDTLIINVHIATMAEEEGYGIVSDGALAIAHGKIVWLGKQEKLPKYERNNVTIVDGDNQWITPGLVDCHTHLVFGGDRANEFEMRLQGKSYEEIANAGGGIVSTVKATRAASVEALFSSALPRLKALHQQGVTLLEIKSGYGLNTEHEVKMLRAAKLLSEAMPVHIQKTFLGAHALPPEFAGKSNDYIKLVCDEMLPTAVDEGLVDAVDVFCEGIGFSASQTEQVFSKAQELNLPVKVHAEQLSNIGGTALAARFNALSSDHIEFLDEAGVVAMKNSGMTAVILPGAFYFLRETQLPPIALLRKHQVPMAIATDTNPGSSPLANIQLMMNMACTLFRMTPCEALAGVTKNGAKALGLGESKGQLQVGYDADIAMWNISQPAQLSYQFGVNPLSKLFRLGEQVI